MQAHGSNKAGVMGIRSPLQGKANVVAHQPLGLTPDLNLTLCQPSNDLLKATTYFPTDNRLVVERHRQVEPSWPVQAPL